VTLEERKEARHRIKRQLGEYRILDKERAQIKDRLTEVEARMTAPGSPNLDGMPRGGQGGDMADRIAAHLALVSRYEAKMLELSDMQNTIERMIDGLDPVERKLLRHRYIEGLEWEKICVLMSYSWRQTHYIHATALDKLVDKEKPEV